MKNITIILIVLVILLSSTIAYLMGKQTQQSNKESLSVLENSPVPSETTTLLNQNAGQPTNTQTPSLSPSPFSTPIQTKIITGGGILSFPQYELIIYTDWNVLRETPNQDSEKLIIKKGNYELSILEGGFGGSACLYPGDADIEGPSVRYDEYKELVNQYGDHFRRSWTTKSSGYGICQLSQYGWGAPTLIGHIAFITPSNPDPLMIAKMDAILSSMKIK